MIHSPLLRSARHTLAAVLFVATACVGRAALDAPVSPNALPGVAAELQFFKNIQGRYILAGQQEIAWSQARKDEDFNYVIATTGRTPSVRGFDFLQYVYSPSVRANQDATERAIAWARTGGIVNFCCHMFMNLGSTNGTPQFYVPGANGNPTGTNFDIRQAIIGGTTENTEFLAKLDIIAAELTKLRDAGVVVVWRPFHECSGNWFWWGRYGAAPFKEAWRIMFNRFTEQYGLNNLIWCFNPTDPIATNVSAWYPGDEFVDMISIDVYPTPGTHPTFAAEYKLMRDFKSGRKVVTMSENGAIPDPDALFTEGAGWAYFCTWNSYEKTPADDNRTHNTPDFLNRVYNHAKVVTLDELSNLYTVYSPPVFLDSQSQAVTAGANVTLTATVPVEVVYQWQRNGREITAGAFGTTLTLTNVQPADTGLYTVDTPSRASAATILGIAASTKITGAGEEIGSDIPHPNGNIFDQVLLKGAAESIIADYPQNQVTRTSFIDLDDDIIQVEFSGPGTLSLVLDTPTGPAAPTKYNQATNYMKGHAGIVITGATEYSNVSVFSVGKATAINQALFKDNVTYDGIADIAFIAIASSNGRFGGVRTANANYFATKGLTGLYAPGVQFTGPVYLGNVTAFAAATPVILLGASTSDNRITGGDLAQLNSRAVQVTGLTRLAFTPGTDSHGNALAAKTNQAVLQQNDVDVTTQIVVNP